MDTKFQKKHESDMSRKEKRELEREKLASMSGNEKLEYILSYYKFHIAALAGLIVLVVGIGVWLDSFRNETMIYTAVINGKELDTGIMEHFQAYRGDDSRRHKYMLDTSVAFSGQDGSGELDYASQMKMVTLVGANTADVFICPEEVYEEYAGEENYLVPVEELMGAEFVSAHEDICRQDAVRIEDSEILQQYGYQSRGPAYFIVFRYSGHQDVAADFLEFLTGQED